MLAPSRKIPSSVRAAGVVAKSASEKHISLARQVIAVVFIRTKNTLALKVSSGQRVEGIAKPTS